MLRLARALAQGPLSRRFPRYACSAVSEVRLESVLLVSRHHGFGRSDDNLGEEVMNEMAGRLQFLAQPLSRIIAQHNKGVGPVEDARPADLPRLLLPETISTADDAAAVMRVLCHYLQIEYKALLRWRGAYISMDNNTRYQNHIRAAGDARANDGLQLDESLLAWAIEQGASLSRSIELARITASSGQSRELIGTSTFFSTRPAPAGAILLSVPQDLTLASSLSISDGPAEEQYDDRQGGVQQPRQPGADGTQLLALEELVKLEDLSLRIAEAYRAPGTDPWHGYAYYLYHGTKPPRNLPFMNASEAPREAGASSHAARVLASLMALLQERELQPVNVAAFRAVLLGESHSTQVGLVHKAHVACRQGPNGDEADKQAVWWRSVVRQQQEDRRDSDKVSGVCQTQEQALKLMNAEEAPLEHIIAQLPLSVLSASLPPLPPAAVQEYRWLLSVVLSRQFSLGRGATVIIPLLDKLNHCVGAARQKSKPKEFQEHRHGAEDPFERAPSCHFTYSSSLFPFDVDDEVSLPSGDGQRSGNVRASDGQGVTGLDVVDNMIAGVPLLRLYDAYIHLTSLTKIAPRQPLTLSYSDIGCSQDSCRWGVAGRADREGCPEAEMRSTQAKGKGAGLSEDDKFFWQATWGYCPAAGCSLNDHDLSEISRFLAARRVAMVPSLLESLKQAAAPKKKN